MHRRGRPKKYRIVRQDPRIIRFSPRGSPGRPDEINLTVDEYEAIRLVDFIGYCQKDAAKSMHIAQPTFSRALKKARRALANGLIRGNTIKIQGGSYVISSREDSQPK